MVQAASELEPPGPLTVSQREQDTAHDFELTRTRRDRRALRVRGERAIALDRVGADLRRGRAARLPAGEQKFRAGSVQMQRGDARHLDRLEVGQIAGAVDRIGANVARAMAGDVERAARRDRRVRRRAGRDAARNDSTPFTGRSSIRRWSRRCQPRRATY